MFKVIRKILAAAAMSAVLFVTNVWSMEVPSVPLEKKVQESDLVAIGTVIAVDVHDARYVGVGRLATIRIETLLKGPAVSNVDLIYGTSIYETDPLCCELGVTYLVFLSLGERGLYSSVYGPNGVYRVDQNKTWPYTSPKP